MTASRRLPLATWPQIDGEGKCRAFTVMRTDGKSMGPYTLNRIREAFGQEALTDEEMESYHVPDWEEEL